MPDAVLHVFRGDAEAGKNRCVRLLQSRPDFHVEREHAALHTDHDAAPVPDPLRRRST
jgi:hypothetical protein